METLNQLYLFKDSTGGTVWFVTFLIIVAICCFVALLEEQLIWASVPIMIFSLTNLFWGSPKFWEYVNFTTVSQYLVIGFIYSLIRTFFKGKELEEYQKKSFDLKGNAFLWWMLWVFDLIRWVLGKLIWNIYDWFYKWFHKMYEAIFYA